jgi:hypothetical protein
MDLIDYARAFTKCKKRGVQRYDAGCCGYVRCGNASQLLVTGDEMTWPKVRDRAKHLEDHPTHPFNLSGAFPVVGRGGVPNFGRPSATMAQRRRAVLPVASLTTRATMRVVSRNPH